MTSSLTRRVLEHKEKKDIKSFTAKYNCDKLVYYIGFHHIEDAIAEETKIKGWRRSKKINLINAMNPTWKDLFDSIEE